MTQKANGFFLTFTLLMILVGGSYVSFNDCGSLYELEEVDIEGCQELPCMLDIGGQHRITFNLIANQMSRTLQQTVYLVLRTIHSGLLVTPDDPCTSLSCPLTFNNNASYSATMHVNSSLVPLPGELFWMVHNEKGQQVLCMRTQIELQYPTGRGRIEQS